jgi:hypothetical protein
MLGYRAFRCRVCERRFNTRTGTPFNHFPFATDLVLPVALWRLRNKLSLRDLAQIFLVPGFEFTHARVCDWEARLAPLIIRRLRPKKQREAVLVRRRNLCESWRQVALFVSSYRSGRQAGRLHLRPGPIRQDQDL